MKRVGLIVSPNFQIMSLAALPVFEFANRVMEEPFYDVQVFSENGGLVKSSFGVSVDTEAFGVPEFDTLLLGGGTEIEPTSQALISFLREAKSSTRRIASICAGAFVLADAGLLDGKSATTHWFNVREFERRYPAVRMDGDKIFVVDGQIWSSAGMSSGIDLALALVENDIGAEAVKMIAKLLVVYHRRLGGQLQFSAMLDLQPKTDRIQRALVYARSNLTGDLSVERLAESASLSVRHFNRAFQSEIGQTPARAVEAIRTEAARLLLERGRLPMNVIAQQTGLGDPERMRRSFLKIYGTTPQNIRRNARSSDDTYDLNGMRPSRTREQLTVLEDV
jgi:transcriptional regulator GlxA family with amidase domain